MRTNTMLVITGLALLWAWSLLPGLLAILYGISRFKLSNSAEAWAVWSGLSFMFVGVIVVGAWVGARAKSGAWWLGVVPCVIAVSALVILEGEVPDVQMSVEYALVYLLFGIPSLIGSICGYMWHARKVKRQSSG